MGLTACVDSNDNHKAVAARQVRDGEDETELIKIVERSRKRQTKNHLIIVDQTILCP